MKIYTKTGDAGETGLFSGLRVSKSSLHVTAYGEVDELNSCLGVVIAHCGDAALNSDLIRIQHDLHRLCSDLATPINAPKNIDRMTPDRVSFLEQKIDAYESELSPLTQFILPGGSSAAAFLHLARTVCRRAERAVVKLGESTAYNLEALKYLNRLSDFLFVVSRVANKRSGRPDILWDKSLS